MPEDSERKISDIIKEVLKDAMRKKNANLGVMNSSSSKSNSGSLLYLQGLIGSIPVRALVDNGVSMSFINSNIIKLNQSDSLSLLEMGVHVILKVSSMLLFAWD